MQPDRWYFQPLFFGCLRRHPARTSCNCSFHRSGVTPTLGSLRPRTILPNLTSSSSLIWRERSRSLEGELLLIQMRWTLRFSGRGGGGTVQQTCIQRTRVGLACKNPGVRPGHLKGHAKECGLPAGYVKRHGETLGPYPTPASAPCGQLRVAKDRSAEMYVCYRHRISDIRKCVFREP